MAGAVAGAAEYLADLLVAVMMFTVAGQLIPPRDLFQKALEPLFHTVVAWLCLTPVL
jgi:hypothetical protein